MSNIELIGSYWTLASGSLPPGADSSGVPEHCPFDLVDRVEAAAKAGFTGMGFWHSDLQNIVKTRSFSEVKKILDANGIVNVEIEFVLDWFLDGRSMFTTRNRVQQSMYTYSVLMTKTVVRLVVSRKESEKGSPNHCGPVTRHHYRDYDEVISGHCVFCGAFHGGG